MNGFQLKTLERAQQNLQGYLSTWELEFVESLLDKPEDYELTDKQNSIVNKISSRI